MRKRYLAHRSEGALSAPKPKQERYMKHPVAILGLGLAIMLVGCGPSEQQDTAPVPAPADEEGITAPQEDRDVSDAGPQVSTVVLQASQHDQHGSYLTDGNARALYVFSRDQPGISNCQNTCIQSYPPLIQRGVVRSEGVEEALIGSIVREGGVRQVTLAGRPLYYYIADRGPERAIAHGIQGFGGIWQLVTPGGTPIDVLD
jgi:predicted lipoprotein with Yx(FWY)xxD motif